MSFTLTDVETDKGMLELSTEDGHNVCVHWVDYEHGAVAEEIRFHFNLGTFVHGDFFDGTLNIWLASVIC